MPSPPVTRNEAKLPPCGRSHFCQARQGSWTVKLNKRLLESQGLQSTIRIYRYDNGAFSCPHCDSSTHDPVNGGRVIPGIASCLTGKEDGFEGAEAAFFIVALDLLLTERAAI